MIVEHCAKLGAMLIFDDRQWPILISTALTQHLNGATDWEDEAEDQEDSKQWQDDWDDDDVAGEFADQLRAEIAKVKAGQSS
eukprot:SAG11_NODE_14179_length_622_cov_0.978967_1_plen_82_part_00